jgi:nucleoside-diphosphate-sugar epimerase
VLTEQRFWLGQRVDDNQYVHSKFVAEDLVLDAIKNKGLNAKIMRVGNLSSRQADGEFQINFNTNNFIATLKAYVALGEVPFDELDTPDEFSPIDELAKAVLLLAETPRDCVVFHPYNNHTILLVDIVEALARSGLFIRGVERQSFEKRLKKAMQNPELVELLRPLMAYDSSGDVTVEDAQLVIRSYCCALVLLPVELTDEQIERSHVLGREEEGHVYQTDAQAILMYSVNRLAGYTHEELKDFFANL